MSWGIRITLLYTGFVAMIVTMVILCSRETMDLEYKDYYARELSFQDKINAISNETKLNESIQHEITTEYLLLKSPKSFQNSDLSGELYFYRPSDATKDVKLPIRFDSSGEQKISRSLFTKGVYKLRITWSMNSKEYFKEIVVNM